MPISNDNSWRLRRQRWSSKQSFESGICKSRILNAIDDGSPIENQNNGKKGNEKGKKKVRIRSFLRSLCLTTYIAAQRKPETGLCITTLSTREELACNVPPNHRVPKATLTHQSSKASTQARQTASERSHSISELQAQLADLIAIHQNNQLLEVTKRTSFTPPRYCKSDQEITLSLNVMCYIVREGSAACVWRTNPFSPSLD